MRQQENILIQLFHLQYLMEKEKQCLFRQITIFYWFQFSPILVLDRSRFLMHQAEILLDLFVIISLLQLVWYDITVFEIKTEIDYSQFFTPDGSRLLVATGFSENSIDLYNGTNFSFISTIANGFPPSTAPSSAQMVLFHLPFKPL